MNLIPCERVLLEGLLLGGCLYSLLRDTNNTENSIMIRNKQIPATTDF